MSQTVRQIRLLANVLNEQGKADSPIVVIGTHANLRPDFPAEKRGGPLRCGGHELRLVPRAKVGELQNLDWIGGEHADV